MRWLFAFVLILAAGSCALAASGLAVAPHVDPPGTARFHDHLLAAYRYPLFLLRLKMQSHPEGGPRWSLEEPGQIGLAALVLATLALLVPKLPRPTRRAIAVVPAVALPKPQWQTWVPLAPPRRSLLAFA
jgi:hypothetical protein